MADPQMDTVQHPTLGTLTFPHDMSPADRNAAIERLEQSQPAQPSGGILDTVKDFGKGVLKGAVHTMSAADDFAGKHLPAFMTTPIGQSPTAENSQRAIQAAKDLATPTNTAQSLGRGTEQMAEFLIPGAGEEKLLGKGASLGAKMLVKGAGAAGVNTLQGGSPVAGFAGGAGGAAVGAGIAKMAAPIAEKAMGIRGVDRAFGRTAGQALLDETTGVRPGTIAKQATAKVGQYGGELNSNAANSTVPVDLSPARSTAQGFLDMATLQNEPGTINEVQGLKDILTTRPTGPIASSVPASEALALKRGVGAYKGSWNPAMQHDLADRAVDATYGVMHPGLEAAIPRYSELNSKISSLLPVATRAGATDLNESLAARVLSRVGARTGAGVLGVTGAYEGRREGGTPGMVLGGLGGMVAPELLTSPTTLMTAARVANSSAIPKLITPAIGAGLQLTRKRDSQ